MKLLVGAILIAALLVAGSIVYASTRPTHVQIERTHRPASAPTACQFCDDSGF